ncbi:unnamed protein product [Clonostachys solani]|uniref:Uncharacterized protein n=1 Tax=Clonostachys solani TaxID=160281 RepID=A0A9N9ZFM9_9HYPO|nr:unnamed protein product [Clonostachys solani]
MNPYVQRLDLYDDIDALQSSIGRMEAEKNDIYFQIRMIEGQIDYFRRNPLAGEIERLEIHKAMLNGRYLEVQGKIGEKHAELRRKRAEVAQLDRDRDRG